MRIFPWIKILFILAVLHLSGSVKAQQSAGQITKSPDITLNTSLLLQKPLPFPRTDTFTLAGVGDIMLGTNFPDESYLPPGNDAGFMLEPVRQYLIDADLTFGNLEGVFAGDQGSPKNCNDPKTCYVFRMPDH